MNKDEIKNNVVQIIKQSNDIALCALPDQPVIKEAARGTI